MRRQALRRSEAEKTDAVKHARKHQLTSALHKASRDTMQQRLEEMADELGELRTASGRHSGLSGRDEADSGRLGEAPNSARTEAGGGRNLFGGGVPAKKTTIAFGDDSARNDSFPTAANGSGAGGGGGGGGGGGRKGSVFNGGSKERKGSVMIGARKGSVFGGSKEPAGGGGGGGGGERGPALEEDGDEARPLSDVDDEKAVALLAKCQECSSHFKGFSPTELVTLARTLAVLHFKEGETILCQGARPPRPLPSLALSPPSPYCPLARSPSRLLPCLALLLTAGLAPSPCPLTHRRASHLFRRRARGRARASRRRYDAHQQGARRG